MFNIELYGMGEEMARETEKKICELIQGIFRPDRYKIIRIFSVVKDGEGKDRPFIRLIAPDSWEIIKVFGKLKELGVELEHEMSMTRDRFYPANNNAGELNKLE